MKNRAKAFQAAAGCWWLIVLIVMYWIEKRLFGGIFACGAVKLMIYSAAVAVVRMIEGPPDEWTKPILPPFVIWIFNGILIFGLSYGLLYSFLKNGKWHLLLLIPEWFSFLLIIVLILLYKKRYGRQPSSALMLFGLGMLMLLGIFLTIQLSGVRTVASMQSDLEEHGYSQIAYKGEQSYLLLDALYGDTPKLRLSDSFREEPERDLREFNTGLYLYSGWKDKKEYALFASPVTGRMIAELPLETYSAYESVLHGN